MKRALRILDWREARRSSLEDMVVRLCGKGKSKVLASFREEFSAG